MRFVSSSNEAFLTVSNQNPGYGLLLRLAPLALWLPVALGCSDTAAAEKSFQEANRLYAARKLSEAAAAYDEALKHDPGHITARLMKGRALYFDRKPKEARVEFQAAVDQEPDHVDALYWLARLTYDSPEKADAALPFLNRALQRDSSHAEALLLKGAIHEKRREFVQAVASYRAAIRNENAVAEAYRRMARLYKQGGKNDESARASLRARAVAGTAAPQTADTNAP